MGTTYYFARPDNHTLFNMDRAFGLGEILGMHNGEDRVDFRLLYLALLEWFHGEDVTPLMAAISKFAESHPIYLITEHHPWLDVDCDDWYDENRLRVFGSRHQVEDEP